MESLLGQDLWVLVRIAAGLGNYVLAIGASLLCVIVLAVFRRVEAKMGTQ